MIMGRKCMQTISAMNLTPQQWPYGDIRIIVLSNTLQQAPQNMQDKVEMYAGDLQALVLSLKQQGLKHAYVDGGATISAFINLKLIDEMTITRAPIILGQGIPLFGPVFKDIRLEGAQAVAFANDFIQVTYRLNYS